MNWKGGQIDLAGRLGIVAMLVAATLAPWIYADHDAGSITGLVLLFVMGAVAFLFVDKPENE